MARNGPEFFFHIRWAHIYTLIHYIYNDYSDDAVKIRPTPFTHTLKEGEVGQTFKCALDCSAQCTNLTLYKNGQAIRFKLKPFIFGEHKLQWIDHGNYHCEAIDSRGKTIRSSDMTINIEGNSI